MGLEFTRKKKKWVVLMAGFGLTSYGFYRVYHLPAIAEKRKRVLKLLGGLISMAEAVSYCAETIGVVSKDLKGFLQSESDQIPVSLKQVSKLTRANEFSESITRVTQALTMGILRGYQLEARSGGKGLNANSSSMDKVMDKLFTEAGAGFASVVVGSFARNLVMGFCSREQSDGELKSNSISLEKNFVPSWLNVVCNHKCRELIGLTNPKHETQVRNVLLTVCNGTIETLVKTSHQVLTNSSSSSSNGSSSVSPSLAIYQYRQDATRDEIYEQQDAFLTELKAMNLFHEVKSDGWVSKVSSTLAEPSNRKFVLDVTGRITFETVRSFLEVLVETLHQGMKKGVKVAQEAVVESGHKVVRYVTAKSSVVATICLSLCLHILGGVWILVPANFFHRVMASYRFIQFLHMFTSLLYFVSNSFNILLEILITIFNLFSDQ
ncbi:hypothetical protein REPUB_Repub10bG0127300 [Reevesia pubescens]